MGERFSSATPPAPSDEQRLSDNQWQSRCLAQMVSLCPSIAIAKAGMLISAASTVGCLRSMAPERAADRLMDGSSGSADARPG